MDILYLSIVFLVIVVIIWLKKPLFVAMIGVDSSYHYFVPGQSEGRGGCSGKADSGLGYNRCAAELYLIYISPAFMLRKRKADKREGFI